MVIELDESFVRGIKDLMAQGANCKINGQTMIDCIERGSKFLLLNTMGGIASPLAQNHDPLPIPLPDDHLRAFRKLVTDGGPSMKSMMLSVQQIIELEKIVFWLAVAAASEAGLSVKTRIAAKMINRQCIATKRQKCKDCKGENGFCTGGDQKGCPCNKDCPPDVSIPSCDNCGGGDDSNKCKGVRRSTCRISFMFNLQYLGFKV